MNRRAVAVLGIAGVFVLAAVLLQTGLWIELVGVGEYERGTVVVQEEAATSEPAETETEPSTDATTVAVRENDTADEQLATVEVRIADTYPQQYVGLSETESLAPDEGMLFVHDETGEHAYVMRNMSFELDIIFIGANGTITTIHHASLPPKGQEGDDLQRYTGHGKFVLEVNRGWANRTGTSVGDQVELPPAAG